MHAVLQRMRDLHFLWPSDHTDRTKPHITWDKPYSCWRCQLDRSLARELPGFGATPARAYQHWTMPGQVHRED